MFDNERQMGISSPKTLLPGCLTAIRGYSGLFKVKISVPEMGIEPRSSQAQSNRVKPRALGAPRTHLPAPNAFGARDLLAKALARDSSEFGVYRSSGLSFESDGSLCSSRFGFCALLCFFAAKDAVILIIAGWAAYPALALGVPRASAVKELSAARPASCTGLHRIAPNCTLEGRGEGDFCWRGGRPDQFTISTARGPGAFSRGCCAALK